MKLHVILAVFKRELAGYFSNPTGYVFISIFVFLSAVAAFWQEAFFSTNLANLDQLNGFFPYLLVFLVPAITMGLWAEEKRNGTDELLLTLPGKDWEVAAGKYLAALGIYTVALFFSLSHLVVLLWLGSPDPGLLASSYLGYWLMGAALLALGMVASLLTGNLTVAFILGALFCSVPVFFHHAGVILSGRLQRLAERLSFVEQFRDLSSGIVTAPTVVYFISFTLVMLYLNVVLLAQQRRSSRANPHYLIRAIALLAIMASLTTLSASLGARVDVTSEKIHSLSPDTIALLKSLDPSRPVFIQAYLSPQVPRSYLQTRSNLLAALREFDVIGGESVHRRIVDTVKYSDESREAQERFGIRPSAVPVTEETAGAPREIFLGLAFTCGPEEFVVPFLDRGLPVEYELMRSIRMVSKSERKKIGILATGVKLFGGFDFQSRRQDNDWPIVEELRKQYEVAQVPADSDYPEDIDVLFAMLPHTLSPAQLDRLVVYVTEGKPLLLILDPFPVFDPALSPHETSENAFQQTGSRVPKTNLRPLLDALGIRWEAGHIAWDKYNPHPQLRNLPPEIVFVAPGSGADQAFNPDEMVSSELQEVVLIYPGVVRADDSGSTRFTPLLTTGPASGIVPWNRLVQQTMFGMALNRNLPHEPDLQTHTLAAVIRGISEDKPIHAIVLADADMLGEQFFELRRRGIETLNFDNVTFLLNAFDQLTGDEAFISLRKRRPRHRTLEAVEAKTRTYEEQRMKELRAAEATAEKQLEEAQQRFDKAVEALRSRADLDEQTREIMIRNLQSVENRRLNVARTNIEDEKQRQIENSRAGMESSIRNIQSTIKLLAVALPPVPALLLFLLVSFRRLRRERMGEHLDRLLEQPKTGPTSAKMGEK
jgi:ABC-2 type transport system permease protein